MKRKDLIYQYVKKNTENLSQEEINFGGGLTTIEISEDLDIIRNNVSKELNILVREEKIVKLEGRPVRYLDASCLKWKPLSKKVNSYKENTLLNKKESPTRETSEKKLKRDLFDYMIGSNGSLRSQMEQAKAAIFYPPKGLNSLIIGPTGSGKTFFANAMYQYSQAKDVIDQEKTMIIFNCADYSQNPQLLMSHLFGHAKGAYTGATEAKDGLLIKAHDNMLFLDEIHRLPPEGQEMLFYFMDTGTFQRMGETEERVSANVRIICATTEDPDSALLKTFVRRIPVSIQLPAFNDRPAKERVQLLRMLLSIEAKRINKRIVVDENVVKALLGSVTYGNIGQLKSNIQLACAKGFLNSMDNQDEVCITMEELTPELQDGLINLAKQRNELNEVSQYLEPRLTLYPDDSVYILEEDTYELPFNLYEIIGDKAALLKSEGVDAESIENFITTDINLHLKSFYKTNKLDFDNEQNLKDIVDQEVITLTKEIWKMAEEHLEYRFKQNFLYAMSLHLSSFIKRSREGVVLTKTNKELENLILNYQAEYEVALMIKEHIQAKYQIAVPEVECWYLTMLLVSLKEQNLIGHVGIIVAAHGKSTATSMVQVVTKLLDVKNVVAVDMPLEMNPNRAYSLISDAVKKVNEGKGVLLLVDMGSLTTFGPKLMRETEIPVKTIDMVTTPVVLEAARKTSLMDNQLEEIYDSLKSFRGYSNFLNYQPVSPADEINGEMQRRKAIVTICSTGEGTAIKIKERVQDLLSSFIDEDVEVFSISLVNMEKRVAEIAEDYHILATAGVSKPTLAVPHLTLEELFQSTGTERIKQVMLESQSDESNFVRSIDTKELCEEYLGTYFTFLNPHKLIDVLWEYCTIIETQVNETFSNSLRIGLIMHVAGVLERVLLNDVLSAEEDTAEKDSVYYEAVIKANQSIKTKLNLTIPESEIFYILNIFDTQAQE
ncbi:sigma 54-interacting transcriptional regulator [Carnobacterium antarcticum]|uniref:Sigma 54-interacting transcriptional regulator n=1 Tax=Carnobacterium antarcticum TaxID=2126436 RepID=A0ABW4NQ78_9LACT|nr:sigma-54-dependent transcriptional regulator [Carnobacterium sp. CP1]ALV22758.1 NtrC family Transcriptional regulator, ATPase domain [Carnobacterium sp. CP1]